MHGLANTVHAKGVAVTGKEVTIPQGVCDNQWVAEIGVGINLTVL